jgi:hypothetical protein
MKEITNSELEWIQKGSGQGASEGTALAFAKKLSGKPRQNARKFCRRDSKPVLHEYNRDASELHQLVHWDNFTFCEILNCLILYVAAVAQPVQGQGFIFIMTTVTRSLASSAV